MSNSKPTGATLPGTFSVRIGYARISDESVSSCYWSPGPLRTRFIEELLVDNDVSEVWYRTSNSLSPTGYNAPVYLKR